MLHVLSSICLYERSFHNHALPESQLKDLELNSNHSCRNAFLIFDKYIYFPFIRKRMRNFSKDLIKNSFITYLKMF